jgi:hypothetical protein
MRQRSLLTVLFCLALTSESLLAQSKSSNSSAPLPIPKEVIIGKTTFIDIGPPFDFYSVYRLTSSKSGTDVEKITVTPPDDACFSSGSATITHAHLEQSLEDLFHHKNLCAIPEKELHREAKRCKICLTFSGMHVTARVQCNGKTRDVRYEILDRDIFEVQPKMPPQTANTSALISTLDQTFGGGDLDRPAFLSEHTTAQTRVDTDDETAHSLIAGKYDDMFRPDLISQIFRNSQQSPKSPLVFIEKSAPSAPISPVMPTYPPIARAAHFSGTVSLLLQPDTEGKVTTVEWINGPELLKQVSLKATANWNFPKEAAGQPQTVTLKFNLNCPAINATERLD